jgi:para-nitrobenzyl esterase
MIGYNLNDVGTLGGAPVDRFCAVRDSLGCKPVYLYEFMRNLPGDDDDPEKDPGAFHSAELWYMFHTLKNSWRPFTEADYALSNKMVDHWTSFCKTGDPGNGWEAYKRDAPFKKEFDVE